MVGDHLLSRDYRPYGILFMMCVRVIIVTMAMMLRATVNYGIIFMTMCGYHFKFTRHS
jgi:hypothetical protein